MYFWRHEEVPRLRFAPLRGWTRELKGDRPMKFTWFNLMPWPLSAGRFPGEEPLGLGRHRPDSCSTRKSHEVYNTYMDLLEYADDARLRRHRRERAPPERLRHHAVAQHHRRGALARRTKDAALVVLGNSIALYNPPVRVAEEFAMLDCISGGRLVAGFPVGTSMDTNYCYGQIPALTREKYAGGARPDHQGVDDARAVRLQRPLQQAAPRQHLAAADPAAASAGPHSRRRLGRDLRLLHRQHLLVFLPQLLRLHPRPGADERLLEAGRAERERRQDRPIAPASPRRSAWPTPTRRPSGSTART